MEGVGPALQQQTLLDRALTNKAHARLPSTHPSARAGAPVIAPEYRHVSMRLTEYIPTIEQLVHSTAAFLTALGHEKVRAAGPVAACVACAALWGVMIAAGGV
jgi:hypothetical protein